MAPRLSFALSSLAIAIVGFALAGSASCSAQGEGDRCTSFNGAQSNNAINGTDECQNGLICQPGSFFAANAAQYGSYDRCCPPPGTVGKEQLAAACQTGVQDAGAVDSGSGVFDGGSDTGPSDAKSTSDAPSDTTPDTTPEASPDAGADAASDAMGNAKGDAPSDAPDAG